MVFDLDQREQRERREEDEQSEPHGHFSAGGPNGCTRPDNKGGGRTETEGCFTLQPLFLSTAFVGLKCFS